MVGAIGHDHRSFADDEADADHVELVLPTELVGLRRGHLLNQCGVADDDDPDTRNPDLAVRPELRVQLVESSGEIAEDEAEEAELLSPSRPWQPRSRIAVRVTLGALLL